MKTYSRINILALIPACLLALSLAGCAEDNNEWSQDYDIKWPLTVIESVSPLSAAPGSTLTVTGTNLQYTYYFYIGTFSCKILSQSDTQLTVEVPAQVTEQSTLSVYNLYRRTYTFEATFTPILE